MSITNKQTRENKIDPDKIYADLIELDRLKGKLAYYKYREMEMRLKCAEYLTKGKTFGNYKYEIEGFKINVKKGQNISLDWKAMVEEDLYDELTPEEQECIRFKPELIDSKFKNLDPEEFSTLADYVTIKPACPEITFTRIYDEEEFE